MLKSVLQLSLPSAFPLESKISRRSSLDYREYTSSRFRYSSTCWIHLFHFIILSLSPLPSFPTSSTSSPAICNPSHVGGKKKRYRRCGFIEKREMETEWKRWEREGGWKNVAMGAQYQITRKRKPGYVFAEAAQDLFDSFVRISVYALVSIKDWFLGSD